MIARPATPLDAVSVPILWDRLVAIADEATVTQLRAAFSTVVRESGDFAVSIMDTHGDTLASSHIGLPSFIATQAMALRSALEVHPAETLVPGDVLVTNDPWLATGQLMDITVLAPVFKEGRLVAFAGSVAHSPDLGGSLRSVFARDVYEEGLFIPVTKLVDAGIPNAELYGLLQANCRQSGRTLGDLEAQLSATAVVAARLVQVMDEEGLDELDALAGEIYARCETMIRNEIAAIPDGTYSAEVLLDNLLPHPVTRVIEPEADPSAIRVDVVVSGSDILVDFSRSSPQRANSTSSVWGFTYAYTAYAIRLLLVPFVANNAGFLRPVRMVAPTGSIVAAAQPAPTNNRHIVGHQVCDAIFTALAPALPDRALVSGGSSPIWMIFTAGPDRNGREYTRWLTINGGLGAFPQKDGEIATFPANLRNTPCEIVETDQPLVVEAKELICDSAGAGRHRGAVGQRFVLRAQRQTLYSMLAAKLENPPRGLLGGSDGLPGRLFLNGRPTLPGDGILEEGDVLTIETPGGGGLHSPCERPVELVLADVAEELVSVAQAQVAYGVVVDGETLRVDEVATAALRATLGRDAVGTR